MTMPPLLRAAMAIASISPWTASPSIVRLPSSSAVVPRMTATSIGNAWIEQPFAAAQRDDLDEVLGRPGVLLAAGLPRIDVRAQPDWPSRAPGRPAAISRMSCESTPCGNEYDSISFASTSAPSLGSLPMLLPMVRRMSPGRPSCEKPRSAKSPMPTTRTVVRSRGRPASAYTVASSSMKRWGKA